MGSLSQGGPLSAPYKEALRSWLGCFLTCLWRACLRQSCRGTSTPLHNSSQQSHSFCGTHCTQSTAKVSRKHCCDCHKRAWARRALASSLGAEPKKEKKVMHKAKLNTALAKLPKGQQEPIKQAQETSQLLSQHHLPLICHSRMALRSPACKK